jgi:hypothetical protein
MRLNGTIFCRGADQCEYEYKILRQEGHNLHGWSRETREVSHASAKYVPSVDGQAWHAYHGWLVNVIRRRICVTTGNNGSQVGLLGRMFYLKYLRKTPLTLVESV